MARKRAAAPADFTRDAYRHIRKSILSGKYTFGAVVSSRRVAAELNMSPLPVLRALQLLEGEGLVESRSRVGSRVVVPSEDDVRGLYAVREALECQAARLCAEHATAEERKQLRLLARSVDEAYAKSAAVGKGAQARRRANLLHVQLHARIAEASHCPKLIQELERSQVLVFKVQLDHAAEKRTRPADWHSSLVEQITGTDPEVADQAMRRHIRHGLEEIIESIGLAAKTEGRWRHSVPPVPPQASGA